MESHDTTEDVSAHGEAPPGVPSGGTETDGAPGPTAAGRPSQRRRSTKGGVGKVAGATPKKAHRPSASSRPRPAGKKPDPGSR